MAFKEFEFDMYCIGDRLLEGVMTKVIVNTANDNIQIEYKTDNDRNYVEGLGAAGTANHWLNEAKKMLKDDWRNWCEY